MWHNFLDSISVTFFSLLHPDNGHLLRIICCETTHVIFIDCIIVSSYRGFTTPFNQLTSCVFITLSLYSLPFIFFLSSFPIFVSLFLSFWIFVYVIFNHFLSMNFNLSFSGSVISFFLIFLFLSSVFFLSFFLYLFIQQL